MRITFLFVISVVIFSTSLTITGVLPLWMAFLIPGLTTILWLAETRISIQSIVELFILAILAPIAFSSITNIANTTYVTTTDNFGQTVTLTHTNTNSTSIPFLNNPDYSYVPTIFQTLLPVIIIIAFATLIIKTLGYEDWHDEEGHITYRRDNDFRTYSYNYSNEQNAFENEILAGDKEFSENA